MDYKIPKFVKWAGGKGQLLSQFEPLFPKSFNRYFEPFVGSGAVFFYVKEKYSPKEAVISDINDELITAYKVIRDDVESLILELKQHKDYHVSEGKSYYLKIREKDHNLLSDVEKAARFIYLNKTCFNGLYRVNSKGKFNVPMGDYKNPDIIQEDKLRAISMLIKNTDIRLMPFENIVNLAEKGDFVYFDPPYYPITKGKNFTSYTKDVFMEEEQTKLFEIFRELDKKGCLVMKSNSDTDFIKSLYKDYNIRIVQASRSINSDASKRGKVNEVVITNYPLNTR
ncbi:MAG: DNA adenine methylase [Candidatus Woesearchaeota archaeon]